MAEHIRQHYIPQCYLNYFGHEKTGSKTTKKEYFLYALRRKNSLPHTVAVENACQIKYFYRLSDESIADNPILNPTTLEVDILGEDIESNFSKLLHSLYIKIDECIRNNYGTFLITLDEKQQLAEYIAIQHLRMPEYRKQVMNITRDGYPKVMEVFKHLVAKIENNPQIANLKLNYNYDEALIHAKMGFLNPIFISPIVNKLLSCKWLFAYSPSNDISTSNNPIVAYSVNDGGLARIDWKSSVVNYPLFPNVLLIIVPNGISDLDDYTFAEIQDFAFNVFHNYLALQSEEIYNYNNKFDNIISFLNGHS